MRGTTVQALTGAVVPRIQKVEDRRQSHEAPVMRSLERCPFQRGARRIGCTPEIPGRARGAGAVRVIADQVADAVAIDRDARPRVGRLPDQTQLGIAALFRLQRAHAIVRVVQIIEGGRPKARAHQRPNLQAIRQRLAGPQAARGLPAVGGIVVMPQAGLHVQRAELPRIPGQQRLIVPRALFGSASHAARGIAVAAHLLVQIFPAQHHLLARLQAQRVLPRRLIARRPVMIRLHRTAAVIIHAMRQLRRRDPTRGLLTPIVKGGARGPGPATEIRRGIRQPGGRIEAGAVVLRIQPGLGGRQPDAMPTCGRHPHVHRAHRALETIPIRVVVTITVTRADGRFATILLMPHAGRIVDGATGTAQANARLTPPIAAQRRMGLQARRPLATPGDQIHHAAHGIRTIQARHRPPHHLDMIDLRQVHGTEIGLPQ